jgi:putative phosphonate metabolism protein
MRFAIFFTPPPDHPLTKAAALWLGRDAFSGEEFAHSAVDGFTRRELRELTAAPRRYGFHATLQAPFRLSAGHSVADVEDTLGSFCAALQPTDLGKLRVTRISSFFALTPASPAPAVNALAADVVRRFDTMRAPPSPEEIERRQPHRLSVRQRENLDRWGYPYVFHDFRFHMTLTGPVPPDRWTDMERILETRFRALLEDPVVIDALSLFVEESPPGDFLVRKRVPVASVRQPLDAA